MQEKILKTQKVKKIICLKPKAFVPSFLCRHNSQHNDTHPNNTERSSKKFGT
jgi:hypothetical protein